ncbi:hypothetical protein ACQBAT_12310 [Ornithinimicrobium sp. Y1847]|uniref:hypothetical protein n=1 Tax=unclassified Ornithinimicrobium TaxID=2615080 RepID=UPI003B66E49B
MALCQQCERRRASTTTVTGRSLCSTCSKESGSQIRAGAIVARGGSVGRVVSGGRTARSFRGMYKGEAEAARQRREKLANTEGFWHRLWVRIVG